MKDQFESQFPNDEEFDQHFKNISKMIENGRVTVDRGFKAVLTLWIIGAIFVLIFWGAVAYIALHFLFKVW